MFDVMDFGADPTGVADSAPAFTSAIASFSPADVARAGMVIVPTGIFRFASPVRVKKSVLIKGSQSASLALSTVIAPDAGVEAFVFERHNTPTGTTSKGAGDWAQLESVIVQPATKVADWQRDHAYSVGDKVRAGSGIGEDWRRHYICATGGSSATSGDGPRSLGDDRTLNYSGRTAEFGLGQEVIGRTSRAAGLIIADTRRGAAGQLRLTRVTGTFADRESLIVNGAVCASADGSAIAVGDLELDNAVRWRYLGSGAGIKIRAHGCTLRDVTVLSASGNGVHIEAQDPDAPGAIANANSWHLDNVNIWKCDGHGLYVNGSDANGGSFVHGVMYGNGSPTSGEDFTGQGYNLYDSSFLGNTYVAIQMGSGGQGSIHCDSVGGGSTLVGCYQEGTGGGENVATGTCVIVGGGLSGSLFARGSVPVVLGPPGHSRGQGHTVAGYSGAPWRPNAVVKLGNKRQNGGRLYEVIKAGKTASADGPSGIGKDIQDGTARWSWVHDETRDGFINLGSVDPEYKAFFTAQSPDDMITGLPTYYRHDDFGGCSDVQGFQYGVSNTGVDGSGPGLMHAVNKSKLDEWPMHIPAGRALFEMLWIGGRRITANAGTGTPSLGTWNPGDRVYFKGAAAVAGGCEGLECVTYGTAGSYAKDRTATADGSTTVLVSGAPMSTLFDGHDFKIGDKLTINGVTARVLAASDTGLELTMQSAVPAGTGLPIAFAAPTFKQFGRITGGAGDSTRSPGNATLNTQKGRSTIAPGAATVTITNDKITTDSIIHATLQTVDTTLTQLFTVAPGRGSFVITGNAAATTAVDVGWSIEE